MIINRYLNQHVNQLTLISAIALIIGLIGKWGSINYLAPIAFIIASIIAGLPIIFRAISALKFKTISIELLVSIAIIAAFLISEFFESAMVSFLFLFGNWLESKTLNKTRSAIKQLTEMQPTKATRLDNNGNSQIVESDDINIGDHIIVKTGEQVPVDGKIIDGNGHLNEAKISGESKPSHKEVNDSVYSGSILQNGNLTIKTTKVGEGTIFGKMIDLVEEAQDNQSHIEKFIDRFAKYYTPAVLIIALITFLITFDLKIAVTLLVLGCPGALVIGAPVSNVAGIGNGSKNNVLIKSGETMNLLSHIDTVVLDKTGTLTKGKMSVLDINNYQGNSLNNLNIAASIEKFSNHPLAQSIIDRAKKEKLNPISIDPNNIQNIKGQGITAQIDSNHYFIGNEKLLNNHRIYLSHKQKERLNTTQAKGYSTVILAKDQEVQMIFGIADELRPNAKQVINQLRNSGIKRIIMLTGDHKKSAQVIGRKIGIDEVHAELLPKQKMEYIDQLKSANYKPAFVGDGINDSPSLASANVGIAIGNGTDVAIDTADVILVSSELNHLLSALTLGKKTTANMKQNITIAILTVVLLLIGLFLGNIQMASGMLFHELSILIVIFNAIRLTKFKLT